MEQLMEIKAIRIARTILEPSMEEMLMLMVMQPETISKTSSIRSFLGTLRTTLELVQTRRTTILVMVKEMLTQVTSRRLSRPQMAVMKMATMILRMVLGKEKVIRMLFLEKTRQMLQMATEMVIWMMVILMI